MGNPDQTYIQPTETIDCSHPDIPEVAVIKTRGLSSDPERAKALFYFVRDEIHYNVYMLSTFIEDFRASVVLCRKKGYCVQKAVLLAAFLRAAGIPSRLAFARIRNYRMPGELKRQTGIDCLPSHGYTQVFLHEKWISITPVFDKTLCKKLNVPACDFDGNDDALLAGRDLSGNPYIEYLEKYEPWADLPFEWLHERIFPIWGHKRPWIDGGDSKGHIMPLSGYRFP